MRAAALIALLVALVACAPAPDYQVAGAKWLDPEAGGGLYDVLAYPLTADELLNFEGSLPALEAAAAARSELWSELAEAEDPAWAASQQRFWKGAGLIGQDMIAVSLKLTFLAEFGSDEEPIEEELRESLRFLESRIKGQEGDAELLATADSLRALLNAIEINREAGAFAYYKSNRLRAEAALDRFTSIGEQ